MKSTKNIALAVLVGALLFYCESPKSNDSSVKLTEEPMQQRPVVYQMFTRLFGNTNQTNQPWGTLEENGVGKFRDISEQALMAIKDKGMTHVWYTGVIEHAVLTDYTEYGIALDDADVVKGRAGSPYAIKDYYDVNPDLAVDVPNRMSEFKELIERTHKAGLAVIIDFVPNHVARAYQSDSKPEGVIDLGEDDNASTAFTSSNNFYYIPGEPFQVPEGYQSLGDHSFPTKDGTFDENPAKATGNDVFSAQPTINDWFETIKLNYGVDYQNERKTYFDPIPDTWLKMRDILLFWSAKGVDGFRCDMAEMVPVQFWEWVTQEVKAQYPETIFIAEIYNPSAYREYIFTGGFDYLYDKVEMYDTLKHIVQGKATTDDIPTIWQRQEGIGEYMLRFLENHDEQRIASPDFAGDPWKGIPMMAVSSFMHKGPIMLYYGQDVGEPGQGVSGFSGDDGRTTIFDYWGVPEHIKWVNKGKYDGGKLSEKQQKLQATYTAIHQASNDYEAIREGEFYDLHYYNRSAEVQGYSDQVYAFIRHTSDEQLLIVINFNTEYETYDLKIPADFWNKIGWSNEGIRFTKFVDLPKDAESIDRVKLTNKEEALSLQIGPLSYQIFKLSE